MTDAQERKPWDRMQGEPFDWHARFQIYRDQGPSRSLAKAYREWTDSSGKPSKTTKAKAKEWRWEERALAYDQHQREGEAVRADAARLRRLDHIHKILTVIAGVIDQAGLEDLSEEEARALLPTVRPLFHKLLEQERLELPTLPKPGEHDQNKLPDLYDEAERVLDTYPTEEVNDDNPS
ncbi:MAG: hypothetical protein OXF62_17275 [Caldilineaceae bacterium]|nr:hypothetical protein [Caldilineaceae bacterium]MCY4092571.1 hypothetical protein [Caldilineaceae bacterium]MDE0180895.1 hypothetical protein [Caldilineaceae bacterium]MDE0432338.1 hypothetical protein [Caldilineaceae bacterium]